uniref:(northern house mosquito) hypothetical protein n=1 Tax=Culex pipiens TaxID=7175 RepID=A0A8D8C2P4_CULPI
MRALTFTFNSTLSASRFNSVYFLATSSNVLPTMSMSSAKQMNWLDRLMIRGYPSQVCSPSRCFAVALTSWERLIWDLGWGQASGDCGSVPNKPSSEPQN